MTSQPVQTAFLKESIIRMMENFGNSFEEDSQDLLVLDTKEIAAPPGAADAVFRAHKVGQVQFDNFVRERLVERTKPTEDAIYRNKLKISSEHASKPQAKGKQHMQSLKNDVDLLSALRRVPEPGWETVNLDEFFQTKSATALSDGDGIRLGVKSDLHAWLEDFSQPKSEVPPTSRIVLDGAVVIQLLKPATAKKLQRVCTAGLYALHVLKTSSRHATGPGV